MLYTDYEVISEQQWAYLDEVPLVRDELRLYVEDKLQPGDFVLAMLEGDLEKAMFRADSHNLKHLKLIYRWVRNNVHPAMSGCVDKVDEWLTSGEEEDNDGS